MTEKIDSPHYDRRQGDRIQNEILNKIEAIEREQKKISECLVGNFDKQGLVSKVAELEKNQKEHILAHWKFTGIIISLTTLFSTLFSKLWEHK